MSVAYDGDVPGLVGTHYGGDGIGIVGNLIPASGTLGPSIIAAAVTVEGAAEYRLVCDTIPTGTVIDEDGDGTSTVRAVISARIYKDGVEMP